MRSARIGFTLTETLIVVAVVLIVAAVLFPVLSRVKIAGQRATAVSNTRQILQAIELYSADHDDRLPFNRNLAEGYWMDEIGLLSAGTPRLRDPRFYYRAEPGHIYESLAGYAMNACLRPDMTTKSLVDPGRTVLVAPSTVWYVRAPLYRHTIATIHLPYPDDRQLQWLEQINPGKSVTPDGSPGSLRYFGSGVYGFLDGHVKSHRPTEFELPPDGGCGFRGTPPQPSSHTGPKFFVHQVR